MARILRFGDFVGREALEKAERACRTWGMRVTGGVAILGRAFGDGLSRSLAGREIAAFDALGAPFWFDLSGLVGTAYRPSVIGRLYSLIGPRLRTARG